MWDSDGNDLSTRRRTFDGEVVSWRSRTDNNRGTSLDDVHFLNHCGVESFFSTTLDCQIEFVLRDIIFSIR